MADHTNNPDDESQIIEWLERKTKCIIIIDDKWISEWATLTEKYFKQETRNHIRLKVVALLSQIFSKHQCVCEDELMNKIILPNFNEVDQETDTVVRKPIVHLLFDIASLCLSYKHCNAVLAIIRKILNKPFKQKVDDSKGPVYVIGNIDIIDSRLIISNLNKLFRTKLYRLPIDPAVNMLDIAVNYLNLIYKFPIQDPVPAEIPMIRRELFSLFLNLRCNNYGHLGIQLPNHSMDQIVYSPFIICVKRPITNELSSPGLDSPPQMNFTNYNHFYQTHYQSIFVSNASQPNCPLVSRCANLDAVFSGLIECINQETDSDVLKLVLEGLPGLLANKPFVLTATNEKINQLCLALSDLTKSTKSSRQNSNVDMVRCGLNCLTSLLIYRKSLEHKSIKHMLSAFEDSLKVSRNQIVPLLTKCLIELQESSEMTRFLPVVLNRLSKFSPTMSLGISMLEFLSCLILFPKLYENFSDEEYKFIFAIALPYTNPFRFTDYITCLAFRTIAMWYLNCRPSLRCAFVEFVKKSLQSNVIQPFKENSTPAYSLTSSPVTQTPPITYSCPPTLSPIDQRRRSASFNTENNFKSMNNGVSSLSCTQLSLQLNEELIETFADLLSRYRHGQCLAIAPKSKFIDLLVDRSTNQTWLLGNSLITVTSGCSSYGWAEIFVRRPTGNTCWVGRLQNTQGALSNLSQQVYLDSLYFSNDVISLFKTMSMTEETGEITDTGVATTPTSSSVTSLSGSLPGIVTGHCSRLRSCDPIPLPKDKKFEIALTNFDHITPYETHKVGVVYVGENQVDNRVAILSNTCGSAKYLEFLRHIGTCVTLNDIDPEVYFIGGLDTKGEDGKYAYFWKDNVTQVIFHVATFMPARQSDPHFNNKIKHIGNDRVCIVYNDSQEHFQMSTIKGIGQILSACIIVTPVDDTTDCVEVEVISGLKDILRDAQHMLEPKVLSNVGASLYARQVAIHLNVSINFYYTFPRHVKISLAIDTID